MIPQAERQKMLAVPLCGPRVISRLEAIGIRSLRELADRDPDELVPAVNLSAGRPIWRPPMAHRAMENLDTAAREAGAAPGALTDSRARASRPTHFAARLCFRSTFMTWNLLHLARMLKDAGGVPAHGNQRTEWDAGCRFDYPDPEHR